MHDKRNLRTKVIALSRSSNPAEGRPTCSRPWSEELELLKAGAWGPERGGGQGAHRALAYVVIYTHGAGAITKTFLSEKIALGGDQWRANS